MKNRYFLISTLVGMFGLFSFAMVSHAQSTSQTNIGERVVGSAALNIRSAPVTGNNIIGHFNGGDKVMVIEKDKYGDWCRVDYNNRNDAWVYCPMLMKATPEGQTVAPEQHSAADTQKNTTTVGEMTVDRAALNVRSKPWMGNNIVGHLNRGDKVTVIEKDKYDWCRIEYKDRRDVWVYCPMLKTADSGSTQTTSEQHGAAISEGQNITVNVSSLNVRSEPQMGKNVIGWLKYGDTVKVLETNDFWSRIEFQGKDNAWVASKYLKQ